MKNEFFTKKPAFVRALMAAFFIAVIVSACSNPPIPTLEPETFVKQIGDPVTGHDEVGIDMCASYEGGYMMAGLENYFGAATYAAIWLVKADASGNCVWSKVYDFYNSDQPSKIIRASGNGYALTGQTSEIAESSNMLFAKIDSEGNAVYNKFGDTGDESGSAIIETTDGFLLGGYTTSMGAGGYDAYLVKADASGDCVWSMTYGTAGQEMLWAIEKAGDDYILICSTNAFGAGGRDVYLIKIDSSGNCIASRTFGGAGYDWCGAVCGDGNGNLVLAGDSSSYAAQNQPYIVMIDANMAIIWEKTVNLPDEAGAQGISRCHDGGYALSGWRTSVTDDGLMLKVDSSGNYLWAAYSGGPKNDGFNTCVAGNDGGIAFFGYYSNTSDNDYYLVRTDNDGVIH